MFYDHNHAHMMTVTQQLQLTDLAVPFEAILPVRGINGIFGQSLPDLLNIEITIKMHYLNILESLTETQNVD